MQCPKCHSDCSREFDLCPRCAAPLQVPHPPHSYRILADCSFCPNCHSAGVVPTFIPERHTRAMLRQTMPCPIPQVLAARGRAITAFFGAPVFRGDGAERAIHGGLETSMRKVRRWRR
jgi:hypothetical protein